MTSQKQIEANRQNALKSKGPTTIEGKTRSSKNAIKHGLLSKDLVIHGECKSEYQIFRQALIDTFLPQGSIEFLLVEKIASCAWRQRRAIQAESSFFHKGLSNHWSPKSLENFFKGQDGACLQNLTRYETALEKNFYRAMQQLKEIQKARQAASLDIFKNGFVW